MTGSSHLISTVRISVFASLMVRAQCAIDAPGPVVINEVLADNRRSVSVAGRHPDFVELYNRTSETVDLGGATLSDGSATQAPLVFATGTRLGPGARWVVWCDRTAGLPYPQAPFGIGANSDRLRLSGPSGQTWDELSFGLQISDHSIGRIPDGTTSWRLNRPTPGLENQEQELEGPARLVLNEWMASPTAGDDWIEVHNAAALPVSLEGLRLTDRTTGAISNRPIPPLSFISAQGFTQFHASDLRSPDADHLDFRLSASGETLRLVGVNGVTILDQVTFGPQESGVSQGRVPDGGQTIVSFPAGQSTPGSGNVRDLTRIVVSEVLSHTDPPFEDAIELFNPTDSPVDVGHWWLSDSADRPQRYRIPAGTVIQAKGYWVAYEYQFSAGPEGFSLNSYEGDEVWLSTGDATGRLTGERAFVRFGALDNGVSFGRVPISGGSDFAPLSRPTLGVEFPISLSQFRTGRGMANAAPRVSWIQLAEVFFASTNTPASAKEPFVEIHNHGSQTLPLYDPAHPTNTWRLRGAVQFDFPSGILMEGNERLVVTAFDPQSEPHRLAAFRAAHLLDATVKVLGPFQGDLSRWKTGLELQWPDVPEGPNKPRPGFVPYVRAERIDDDSGQPADWPWISEGSRLALVRRAPDTFSNDSAAWMAAPPSPGRTEAIGQEPDTDGDGIPDPWETQHSLNPALASDAMEDPDGDGATHLEEYLANTHPRDGTSVLRLSTAVIDGGIFLSFQTEGGREHRLEIRGATSEPWTVVTQFSRAEASMKRTLPVAPQSKSQWFRVSAFGAP